MYIRVCVVSGILGRSVVSLICWALWPVGRQSDMFGFVAGWALWPVGRQSDMFGFVAGRLVGLCGRSVVSLICWALWPVGRQSDMLGFVAGRSSV